MIVFIHHSVNPYRVAFFNRLKKSKIKFKVYFLSKPAKNRKWKISDYKMDFDYEFLPGWKIYFLGGDHSYFQINHEIVAKLNEDSPKLIITIGWNYLATFIALVWAKFKKRKFVVWSESTEYEKSIQRLLTLPIIKILIRNSDYLISAGTRSKKYLLKLGARLKNICTAYYTVDTDRFINKIKSLRKKQGLIRKKYNINKKTMLVLFVGGFIKRKGVLELLHMAKLLQSHPLVFMLVGFGPLQGYIEKFINQNDLKNIINVGYVENNKTPSYYMDADVFILPSLEDTWGLVVNEAMCAGKPVIVSKYAGCSDDLVKNGINGYLIDPSNIKKNSQLIQSLINNNNKLKNMGKESFSIINKFNLDQNVQVVKDIWNRI